MTFRTLAALLGAVVLCGAGVAQAVVDVSGPARGIAVAPFVTTTSSSGEEAAVPDVASILAGELTARSSARVITPAELRRDDRGIDDPQARDVRRWAEWNDVENVVVGRTARAPRGRLDVAVELRSGHSGAARAEYRLTPESDEDLSGAVERLANLILADLGEEAAVVNDSLPSVAAAAPGGPSPEGAEPVGSKDGPVGSKDGKDASAESKDSGMGLLPGTSRDEPMSINSEELEVLPEDGGRRLVFSRNVEVMQGDIILHADRLEAVYPQGASQPDLLIASGNVRVSQGDRRARCEEATYERTAHTIVCRGQAEVTQGCDQVRGEEIQFDLGGERVRVVGAASVVIRPDDDETGECVPAVSAEGGDR